MTIQHRSFSKILLICFLFTVSNKLFANECVSEFEVLERRGSNNYRFVKKQLNDLKCNGTFEGKHFKVVYQKSNEAISFDSDPELVKRAANVYFHLTKARNFWVHEMNSEFVKNLEQLTIRVQITNGFSRLAHYTNDNFVQNNNNAWTIPAGQTSRWAEQQDVWGQEIWFSPMKKVESRKLITSSGNNPVATQLEGLKVPVINYTENSLIMNTLDHLAYPEYQDTSILNMVVTHLGVMAVMFGSVEISKKLDKLFMNKYYYLDTAMIPEIIYHEFSHVALSDSLNPVHSIAVIEGMADYFATRIADTIKMYRSIKDFSTNAEKNARSKAFYSPYFELENNASSDFTLSVLWLVKEELDNENERMIERGLPPIANVDQYIYSMRQRIDETSSILDLTHALRKEASNRDVCDNKRLCIGAINKVLTNKGF